MKKLETIIKETIPTLVVFQHAGDGDDVEVDSLVEEIKVKYSDKARVEQIDCSKNGNIKEHFKFKEYPTYILFKEGQELMRESGKKTVAQLEDMLQRAL